MSEFSSVVSRNVRQGPGMSSPPSVSTRQYSTSSALPDVTAKDKLPILAAGVHSRINAHRLRQLRAEDLVFRSLRESDLEELKLLHGEWFPLTYDESFYASCVNGGSKTQFITCAAVLPEDDTCVLGLATVTLSCVYHRADIGQVLNMACDSACVDGSRIAYILTLGIIDEFRRRGLAKLLIRETLRRIMENEQVCAVTLHVITYNNAAIALYTSLGFMDLGFFPDYYDIGGQLHGAYLLAKYLKGTPPLAVRFRRASAQLNGYRMGTPKHACRIFMVRQKTLQSGRQGERSWRAVNVGWRNVTWRASAARRRLNAGRIPRYPADAYTQ